MLNVEELFICCALQTNIFCVVQLLVKSNVENDFNANKKALQ